MGLTWVVDGDERRRCIGSVQGLSAQGDKVGSRGWDLVGRVRMGVFVHSKAFASFVNAQKRKKK